ELGIVQVMASLKDSGNSQFLRQNHVAQLVDRFFFFIPLGIFQFFDAIEDLPKIAGRIDGDLVADVRLQFTRELNAEHSRFAFQVELTEFDEFSQRNDLFFFGRIDAANQGCDSPVLKFQNNWSLDVRGRRNDACGVVDFCFERSPIAQDVFRAHKNMRIEIDYFLTQFAIEPGHNRNHENQHRYAERHTNNRNQSDD